MNDPSTGDAFLDAVGTFAAREVEPAAEAIDRDARLPDGLIDALARLDLFTLGAPLETGGCGASVPVTLSCVAAIATASPSVALLLVTAHAAAAAGAAVPDLAAAVIGRPVAILDSGSVRASGPEAGATLSGVAPRVEHPAAVGHFLVVATVGEEEHLFAVPKSAAGVSVGLPLPTTGLRGAGARPVILNAVPAGAHLGATAPIEALRRWLGLGLGAVAVGAARRALTEADAYAAERRQFGRHIGEFPAVRTILDGCEDLVAAAEGQLGAAGQAEERGAGTPRQAARAARRAARTAVAVCLDSVQVHGGYGYVAGSPVERLLRDAVSIRALAGQLYVRTGAVESRHLTFGLLPDLTR